MSSTGSNSVLLVHGFASSVRSSWEKFGWLEALSSSGFDVVAEDLPGHGTAEKPVDPESYGNIEEEVRSLIRSTPVRYGVGFSMGGRILLRIESDHPGTFERIVVGGLGANVLARRRPGALADAIESGGAADVDGDLLTDDLIRAVDRAGPDRQALVAFLRRPGRRLFTTDDLRRIRCPVLTVVGELDGGAHPVSALLDALPNASGELISGADHVGTMRSPAFLNLALEFLRRPEVGLSTRSLQSGGPG